ncbi:hypothetical protein H6G54_02775 [Anabaena cylindrica FACHB-243]|uniref:Uncharacterized protein n=1 Tax=Anabaena cylindrica (strain ATCC 27899 / PCC 7122) TaxID=272123 RepID=K9ZS47_ANACC|nr:MULTISPECIES: hypothetical protein [Anabaena]AFZ61352.1 hypothetical protein Anacy_6077 [Anabaena cylindrica PCC 7122]MBD2416651.1 hypothetical protein [Anabaena cylindrica FACHB-243]MBY5281110.1 hypothetical protein [Anabaena sp. CCAP 1446/1C]MBY5306736.1 hypothetical protein [Anabaena sp. CCAP 1446/1C]MCM2410104.1 hypothetical protein [Anabaena sp. CCAP 1446/1C]
MGLFSKPKTDNELGEYLPDSDAQPCTESEEIGARNRSQAQKKCEETAEEYGGTDAQASPTDRPGRWDCNFKVWR